MVTDFIRTEGSVILSNRKCIGMHLHLLDNVPYLDTDLSLEDGRGERQGGLEYARVSLQNRVYRGNDVSNYRRPALPRFENRTAALFERLPHDNQDDGGGTRGICAFKRDSCA